MRVLLVPAVITVALLLLLVVYTRRRGDAAPTKPPRNALTRTAGERAKLAAEARGLAGTLAGIFRDVEPMLVPGVTTREIDARVQRSIEAAGVRSSFKGYHGFPAHSITSINEEVANGVPGNRRLAEGDLLKLEIGIAGQTTFAIRAWTYPIGSVNPEDEKLMAAARLALGDAVTVARAGGRTGDISAAIQTRIEGAGFNVARQLVGFGIGEYPHEDPPIPGFGRRGSGAQLVPDEILSIYVIALAGESETVTRDRWTDRTKDGRRSVTYSQMLVLRDGDPELLNRAGP